MRLLVKNHTVDESEQKGREKPSETAVDIFLLCRVGCILDTAQWCTKTRERMGGSLELNCCVCLCLCQHLCEDTLLYRLGHRNCRKNHSSLMSPQWRFPLVLVSPRQCRSSGRKAEHSGQQSMLRLGEQPLYGVLLHLLALKMLGIGFRQQCLSCFLHSSRAVMLYLPIRNYHLFDEADFSFLLSIHF